MPRRSIFTLILLLVALFVTSSAFAAEINIEIVPRSRVNPVHPEQVVAKGLEGWVQMSLIITPEGNVKDVLVIRSSDEFFEKPAVDALSTWTYNPVASRVGPEGASVVTLFRMRLDETPGNAPAFLRVYSQMEAVLNEGKVGEAATLLQQAHAEKRSIVDDAMYNWLTFRYQLIRGDGLAAAEALEKCLAMREVVPPDLLVGVFESAFTIAMNNNQPKRAQELLLSFKASGVSMRSDAYDSVLLKLMGEEPRLADKLNDRVPIAISAQVAEHYWEHKLLLRNFELRDVIGSLQGIDVRCRNAMGVHFAIVPGTRYQAPEGSGECLLFVKGEPGARFTLVEYPGAAQ